MTVSWTNPHAVDIRKGVGFVYFIRVLEPTTGREHRYIGQTTSGERRLRAYRRNVERIFDGFPRRSTHGQENYRAVHLALAKACEHGWQYEFYPLENCEIKDLDHSERTRIREFDCDLNTARSWAVADYHRLTIGDLFS